MRNPLHRARQQTAATFLVPLLALMSGCADPAGERPALRVLARLQDGTGVQGTPAAWHSDYVTLRTEDGTHQVLRREEISHIESIAPSASGPEHGTSSVFWYYEGGEEPVEGIEGCGEMESTRQPEGYQITCRTSAGPVGFVIPEETFAIQGWSRQKVGDDHVLIIRSRDVTGHRVELRWADDQKEERPEPPALEHPEPPTLEHPEPPTLTEWEDIYRSLRDGIRREPVDLATQLTYVNACFETDRLEEARTRLDELLERSPAQPEYVYWRGVIHLAQGNHGQAAALLGGVRARIVQRIPEVHMYLGIAHLNLGNVDRGCDAFRAYLDDHVTPYRTAVEQQFKARCESSEGSVP